MTLFQRLILAAFVLLLSIATLYLGYLFVMLELPPSDWLIPARALSFLTAVLAFAAAGHLPDWILIPVARFVIFVSSPFKKPKAE